MTGKITKNDGKTEEQLDQEFLDWYQKGCEKRRRELKSIPALKYSQERNESVIVGNLVIKRWLENTK